MRHTETSDCNRDAQGAFGAAQLLGRRAKWLKENAEKVRQYKRRSAKKAYAANPEKYKRRQKKWRKQNNQWARERDAIYRQKYASDRRAQFAAWRKKHRNYFKARHDADVDNLAEWYVRAKLSRKTAIKPSEWPASLVELMRAQLKVKRLWRNLKTLKN